MPPADEDWASELVALTAAARAWVEVEEDLGGQGLSLGDASLLVASGPSVQAAPVFAAPVVSERDRRTEVAVPTAVSAASAAGSEREVLAPDQRRKRLALLADEAASCTACVLHEKRNRSVFARGNPDAELVFVGEGPGRDEDLQGEPFVGAAGQLLDRMIAAMGYARDEVYICNVVKCRPPDNRTPRPEEAIACSRFLVPQIDAVAPKMLVALGRCAAQALGAADATGPWRGRFTTFRGLPLMSTYHPAFLLRSPEQKRVVWEDLQQVMARLGKTVEKRRG